MSYFMTDDPYADFDRWDAEQARAEARLPQCEGCGESISDDDYYEIENEILCEDCMKERYKKRTEDFIQNH